MRTLMPAPTPTFEAGSPAFSAADSAVFERTRAGAAWTDLDSAAQERFRSIRGRLKELALQLVEPATRAGLPAVSFVSTLNPNGRVPGELWSCVFPQAVGNKSYALQFAIILNGTGAEICCCLGAGTSQTQAPEAVREYQEAWENLRRRLTSAPVPMLQTVEASLGDRWQLRNSWLLEPGRRDFSTLGDWLAFAASDTGPGASISRNLTPQALEETGSGLLNELLRDLETFAPLFMHVYAPAAEGTIGRLPLMIADGFQLHPLLLEDLQRTHSDMLANGDLRSRDALEGYYDTFRLRFGPETLRASEGEELLSLMHENKRDSMLYWLEFKNDEEFPSIFGSIAGGSALKYGFYRRQETGEWMTGSPSAQRIISTAEAVTLARRDRDQLLAASDLLASLPDNADDAAYTTLQEELTRIAPDVQGTSWGHKYLSLLYPTKLDDYHALNHQRFHLIKLFQTPSAAEGRYVNAPRFVALGRALGWPMNQLTTALNKRNGPPHRYWRVGTRAGDTGKSHWDRMKREGVVTIGWSKLGDLSSALTGDRFREVVRQRLAKLYPADARVTGRAAQQVTRFCQTIQDRDYVLPSDGATVLGIGRINSQYSHASAEGFPHERSVEWLDLGDWRLPTPEGLRTTIFELRKRPDNLVAIEQRVLEAQAPPLSPVTAPGSVGDGGTRKHATWTGAGKIGRIQDLLNRKGQAILYGPPGTGKTYWAEESAAALAALWNFGVSHEQLSVEQRERLDAFVRVCTFHPSYGYEDFIEGYRPHADHGGIQFALQNGIFKTLCETAGGDPDGRYYLIIDEINRGDIPRIFGELLTLLDKPKRGLGGRAPTQRSALRCAGQSVCHWHYEYCGSFDRLAGHGLAATLRVHRVNARSRGIGRHGYRGDRAEALARCLEPANHGTRGTRWPQSAGGSLLSDVGRTANP